VKRLFDLAASAIGLALLWPVLFLIALAIKLTAPGPAIYAARRVGRHGRIFCMYKFRTMVVGADRMGGSCTSAGDPRVTGTGVWLRRHKLDELPQLFNVLRGEMSLVGPRPEVEEFVQLFSTEERAILSVLPGITDWASVWNCDEASALAGSADPELTYRKTIRPEKLRLQLEYVRRRSFWIDLTILFATLKLLLWRSAPTLPIETVQLPRQRES
jgi:lipopolysaccharide/colanic/teichoic acid biosynthesis glycosyltransferase